MIDDTAATPESPQVSDPLPVRNLRAESAHAPPENPLLTLFAGLVVDESLISPADSPADNDRPPPDSITICLSRESLVEVRAKRRAQKRSLWHKDDLIHQQARAMQGVTRVSGTAGGGRGPNGSDAEGRVEPEVDEREHQPALRQRQRRYYAPYGEGLSPEFLRIQQMRLDYADALGPDEDHDADDGFEPFGDEGTGPAGNGD